MAAHPIQVLVAEDEPAMLNLLARHMRSLGFDVIEASEGDVALELAEQKAPDLVILDVMMPGMSGWEICKRLKSHTTGPLTETGVIMLTGIGENLNEMTSSLFAADAWLNKPFEFSELDEKIRETLARYGKSGGAAEAEEGEGEEEQEAPPRRAPAKRAPKKAAKKAAKKPAAKKAAKKPAAKKAGKKAAKKPAKKAAKKVGKKAAKKPAKKASKKRGAR